MCLAHAPWYRLGRLFLLVSTIVAMGFVPVSPTSAATLTIATGSEAISLNPADAIDLPSIMVTRHIYDGLVDFNEKMEIVPGLAESWSVSSDKLVWTFRLRKNVKFHDGTSLDATAVKASFDWIRDPKNGNRARSVIAAIEAVDAVGAQTIRITTKAPFAPLLFHLANGQGGWVLSPTALKSVGKNIGRQPVGTGPYKLVEWRAGQEIVLERNVDFWGGAPAYDRLVFKTVREPSSRIVMLETGAVDVALNLPPIERKRLEGLRDIQVDVDPTNRLVYIGLGTTKVPLTDVRVRQALNYAIDKNGIVMGILRGLGQAPVSPIGPGTWGHTTVGRYDYDVAKAKALLAEAGKAGGFPMTVYYSPGRYLQDKEVLEVVQSQLQEVGVQVHLKALEWGAFRALLRDNQDTKKHPTPVLDAYLFGFAPSTGDAHHALYGQYHSGPVASWNYMRYQNPRVDDLLTTGMTTVDVADRRDAYRKAQEMIFQDAPAIFLFSEQQINASRKGVSGIQVFPMFVQFRNARPAK